MHAHSSHPIPEHAHLTEWVAGTSEQERLLCMTDRLKQHLGRCATGEGGGAYPAVVVPGLALRMRKHSNELGDACKQ